MRPILLTTAAIAALSLAACSVGNAKSEPAAPASGSGTSRTFAVADFTKVELKGSDDVDVRVGSGFSVRAEGPEKELEKLRITRKGDTLVVERESEMGFRWGSGDRGVTVFVTMPRITTAAIEGSGNVVVDRVEGESFAAAGAGSGDLRLGGVAVKSLDMSLAGSGNITATGAAEQMKISIAGSGDVDARGLKAKGADVSIAGSGNVTGDVDGAANVSLMGSGDVDLGRKARCTTSKMGSGDVRCG